MLNGAWTITAMGKWDGPTIDKLLYISAVTVIIRWSAIGMAPETQHRYFATFSGEWLLEMNGNGNSDGWYIDGCIKSFRPRRSLLSFGMVNRESSVLSSRRFTLMRVSKPRVSFRR